MKITKCPYCSKQLSYFSAFSNRNRGEYFCNNCKKESNILIKKVLLIPFILAVIVSLLILLVFFLFTDKENLWFMLFVAVPFFVFYLLTPFYIVLRPRKKHMDALYDTQIVESPVVEPDPTMAQTSHVIPAFVDDVVFDSDKPVINEDVFKAIKEEKRVIEENSSGDTKSFSGFENISSSKVSSNTMPVANIKDVEKRISEEENDGSYDLSIFE